MLALAGVVRSAGNVDDGNFLGAFGFTLSFIRAIAESQLVHGAQHFDGPLGGFRPSLGQ